MKACLTTGQYMVLARKICLYPQLLGVTANTPKVCSHVYIVTKKILTQSVLLLVLEGLRIAKSECLQSLDDKFESLAESFI